MPLLGRQRQVCECAAKHSDAQELSAVHINTSAPWAYHRQCIGASAPYESALDAMSGMYIGRLRVGTTGRISASDAWAEYMWAEQ